MPQLYTSKSSVDLWKEFFNVEPIFSTIKEALNSYPDSRSVTVNFRDVVEFNPDFAEHLILEPRNTLAAAEEALADVVKPLSEEDVRLKLRIVKLPGSSKIQIRNLRSDHIGKFVSLRGLLRKVTEVRPKLKIGAFKCAACGHELMVEQHKDVFTEPLECAENEGGCGRKGNSAKFYFLFEKSFFVDSQKVELQESPENLRGGEQPQRITGYIEGDITGLVAPGDEVTLNGIIETRERRYGMSKSTIFDIVLNVNSIEMDETKAEDIEISEEDVEKIIALSKDKNIYEKMIKSIAPTIYGMEHIKEALVLQLFGGVKKKVAETMIRGDIHVLLIGDPGTAKSQLLRFISELSPRGIYSSGQASTKAGLTATAVKDEFGEGRWTLEAGALVLADKGIACIDELDKMNKEDRSSMHEALEQQRISIAKAGITATLQCRCSLLAAANPKSGRFDPFRPIYEEINLPSPLLTRFDVIFPIMDSPERDRDTRLATHVINVHTQGEIEMLLENRENISPVQMVEENEIEKLKPEEETKPAVEPEILRKYIAYAKKNVFPVLSEESREYLNNYYVKIRNEINREEPRRVPITARQLEAFIRLAEASAKVRLSPVVEKEDVLRAIRIVRHYIEGLTQEKGYDFDVVEVGATSSQREKIRLILDVIKRITEEKGRERASLKDIIDACAELHLAASEVKRLLEKMKVNALIYESMNEYGLVNQY